eukprot:TRINITY_DN16847_c0_g1_i1.p1 TRINITY_DN16847_c0_g1~~TRINITY_DN16847_c0_g1_i1.p1  ORF type:complete len:589 (+),score=155.51 TRINITY_DN16847_c0_g1_i1:56-1768(+)
MARESIVESNFTGSGSGTPVAEPPMLAPQPTGPTLRPVAAASKSPIRQSPAAAMLWWKSRRRRRRRRTGEAEIECAPPDSPSSSSSEPRQLPPPRRPHPLARPASALPKRAPPPLPAESPVRRPQSAQGPRVQPQWKSLTSAERRSPPTSPVAACGVESQDLAVLAQHIAPSSLFRKSTPHQEGFSMRHIDLRWLAPSSLRPGFFGGAHQRKRTFRAKQPAARHTLHSMPEDHLLKVKEADASSGVPGQWHPPSAAAREAIVLNSPRSALVLMRLGLSVRDLQQLSIRDHPVAADVGCPPELVRRRYQLAEEERSGLLQRCREGYRLLCDELPLSHVISFYEDLWNARLGPDHLRDHGRSGAVRGSLLSPESPYAATLGPSGAARRLHDTARAVRILGAKDADDELWEHAAHPQSERHRRRLVTMLTRQNRDLRAKRLRQARAEARRRQAVAARSVGSSLAWKIRKEDSERLMASRKGRVLALARADAMQRCAILDRVQDVTDIGDRARSVCGAVAAVARRRNRTAPDALRVIHGKLGSSDAKAERSLRTAVTRVLIGQPADAQVSLPAA